MTTPLRYTPPLETQLSDGGPCPEKDCVACCGATLANAASVGRWNLSGPAIRRKAGVSCWSGTGGLTYEKMAYGVRELTNGEVAIRVYYRRTREQARDALLGGASGAFSISYAVLQGTGFEADADYTGGHGVVLNDYYQLSRDHVQLGDPLADGRREGIRKGWVRAPASLIWRACEARSAQFNSWGITMALAPDTEGVIRKARVASDVYRYASPESRDVGNLGRGVFVKVLGTRKGESWVRDTDGGRSNGWWRIKLANGVIGFVRGEVLVPV